MNQQHLIQWLNSGDSRLQNEAFEIINKEMKQAVLQRTRSFTHIDEDEIWNIALTALWMYLDRKTFEYRGEGSLSRFLCKICNWLVLRECRKANRYSLEINFLAMFSDDFSAEDALNEIQLLETVKRLLSVHLNEVELNILINKYYLGMSYEEMSGTLNRSSDTLKTTKYRAMNKLKKTLNKDAELRNYLSQLLYRRKAVA